MSDEKIPDLLTAFNIANSGLSGDKLTGDTVKANGLDGSKTFLNTGAGYCEYSPELKAALEKIGRIDLHSLKKAVIDIRFASEDQINKMSDTEFQIYAANILTNYPNFFKKVELNGESQLTGQSHL